MPGAAGEELQGIREGFPEEGLEREEGAQRRAEATAWAQARKGGSGGFQEHLPHETHGPSTSTYTPPTPTPLT